MVDSLSILLSIFLLLGTAAFTIVVAFTFFSFSFSKIVVMRRGFWRRL